MKRLMTETDWFWVILDRVKLYLIGRADRLADGPTVLAAEGSTIPPRCRQRVGTV
jgi:hypothetical protein